MCCSVTNEEFRRRGACLFAFDKTNFKCDLNSSLQLHSTDNSSPFSALQELCRKVYFANYGLKAILNNENGKIRETHVIPIVAAYILYFKARFMEYAEQYNLEALLEEVEYDLKQPETDEVSNRDSDVDSEEDSEEGSVGKSDSKEDSDDGAEDSHEDVREKPQEIKSHPNVWKAMASHMRRFFSFCMRFKFPRVGI